MTPSLPRLTTVALALIDNNNKINYELLAARGVSVDIGGSFHPNPELATKAMCPTAHPQGPHQHQP